MLSGCFLQVRQLRDDVNMLNARVLQMSQDAAADQARLGQLRQENLELRQQIASLQGDNSEWRTEQENRLRTAEEARRRAEQSLLEDRAAMARDVEARTERENALRLEIEQLSGENESLANEILLLTQQLEEATALAESNAALFEEAGNRAVALEAERDALKAERDDARAERDDFRRQTLALSTNHAEASKELETVSGTLRDREKELAAVRRELEEAKAAQAKSAEEAARVAETREALRGQLAARLGGSTALSLPEGNDLRIRLKSDGLFKSGTVLLSDEGEALLKSVAGALKGLDYTILVVEGHTDNVPVRNMPFVDNWDLGAARAASVTRFLTGSAEIPSRKLRAQSHAFFDPVGGNDTPEGRALNRRVDIVVVP
jgi:chemotaxis protein MotB